MSFAIDIGQLLYTYPNQLQPALSIENWQVEAGEWVYIQGKNGSGKSTFLKILSGALPRFYGGEVVGTVSFFGHSLIGIDPIEHTRLVGYVHQQPEAQSVYQHVAQEVAFTMENLGFHPSQMHWRVTEVLEMMGILHLRDKPLAELSGGMRQRVALAAAIAHHPKILLLDEPTSQVDPAAAQSILQMIHQFQLEWGMTVVMTEHQSQSIYPYAGQVVILEQGSMVWRGAACEAVAWWRQHNPIFLPITAQYPLCSETSPLEAPLSVQDMRQKLLHGMRQKTAGDSAKISSEDKQIDKRCIDFSKQGTAKVDPVQGLVELQNVNAYYPLAEKLVLQELSLSLKEQSKICLIGPNGSGKSSILRLLAGMLFVHSGKAKGSLLATHMRKGKRMVLKDIAYLPQNPAQWLFEESVEEEFRRVFRRFNQPLTEERLVQMLKQVHLLAERHRSPQDLSGGEQLRLSISLTLLLKPRLLLLDEPTRGLDAETRIWLLDELTRWDGTVCMATHDLELVAEWADEVVFIDSGQAVVVDNPRRWMSQAMLYAPVLARAFRGVDDEVFTWKDAGLRGWTLCKSPC